MHTGFSALMYWYYANAPVPTMEELRRYDLAWKDGSSVLNALSKVNRIIKGIVISLCSWIFVTHRKTPALAQDFPVLPEM